MRAKVPTVSVPAQFGSDLQGQLAKLQAEIQKLRIENEWFRERFKLDRHFKFGSSSERVQSITGGLFDNSEAQAIFDEAELTLTGVPAADLTEPTAADLTAKHADSGEEGSKGKEGKDKRGRTTDGATLEVEEIRCELDNDAAVCGKCQGGLHAMGSEDRDILEFVPPRWKTVRYIRVKYACRQCAAQGERTAPVLAPLAVPLLPGLMISPAGLAYLMSQKYEMAVPLYRIEQYFLARGLKISRQTMANWMIRGADLFKPVFLRWRELLLQQDIIHADETRVQVLHEIGKTAQSESRMWVYRSGRYGVPLVLYDYQPSREGHHAARFLRGFVGVIHADGYQVYEALPDVRVAGCLAHARRTFVEAITVLDLPPGTDRKKVAACQGLAFCQALYEVERKAKDMTVDQCFAYRQQFSAPLLAQFHAWLMAQSIAQQDSRTMKEAIGYCLNQWDKLNTFLTDGRLEIDNNLCERAVKPFAVGRKNWLFANVPAGATASAIIYSVVETAKANNLIPEEYIKYLLERLGAAALKDNHALDALLPWSPEVQTACGKAAKKRR